MRAEIRSTEDDDLPVILGLVASAFGEAEGPEVAELVKDLLADRTAQPTLSLAAIADGEIVGYLLFSRVRIEGGTAVPAAILAPLAVRPDRQQQGIGGQLIREGLRRLQDAGTDLVFVLGHPGYYPRYGFAPAGVRGFEASYPIPEKNADAWMVQELRPGVIGRVSGKVRCAKMLDKPEYWRE